MVDRIACCQCRQCNVKGKPSVMRSSKYCDNHFVHKIEVKKQWFSWLTDIKDKFFEKRAKYDDDGNLKEMDNKGFRPDWIWR